MLLDVKYIDIYYFNLVTHSQAQATFLHKCITIRYGKRTKSDNTKRIATYSGTALSRLSYLLRPCEFLAFPDHVG